MIEAPWGQSAVNIMRAAGWELLHQSDEQWVAVHAATGRIASIWIDYEKTVRWRNLVSGSIDEFNTCQELAASNLLDCLTERKDHDEWLEKLFEEDSQ